MSTENLNSNDSTIDDSYDHNGTLKYWQAIFDPSIIEKEVAEFFKDYDFSKMTFSSDRFGSNIYCAL